MPRVLCAGHVNWDVTLRVDSLPEADGEVRLEERVQKSGGSAANVACALAGLGVETTLLGSVGDDEFGRLAMAELEEAGVDTGAVRTVADAETAVKYLVVDGSGEVMVLANDGANEAFGPEHVPESAVSEADHLHLTSQRPETAAALAERAHDAGVSVSFDPGRRLEGRDYSAALESVDFLFLNEREAAAFLAGGNTTRPSLVVTRGEEGAEIRHAETRRSHPGFAVDAVDTTGAGDAFAAGFLAARLRGDDEARALEVANACGAAASRHVGARSPVGWDDVHTLVD